MTTKSAATERHGELLTAITVWLWVVAAIAAAFDGNWFALTACVGAALAKLQVWNHKRGGQW